jgi:hypothetical protein
MVFKLAARKLTSARGFNRPKAERDVLFCKKFLQHFDKDRAYREAGFTSKNPTTVAAASSRKLAKFADYLLPLQQAKAREAAKVILVDQEAILNAMARKAVFDPGDYVEKGAEPLTETITENKAKITRTRTWQGKPLYPERMKPFHELTREQRMTVEVTGVVGDQVQYRLPTNREQHASQIAVGRQYGMFLEKLIIERAQAGKGKSQLQLSNIPTTALQKLTLELLPYVGQEFASQLGFTVEDIEDAQKRVVSEVGRRSG